MLKVELGDTVHLSEIALPAGVTSVALSHGEESDLSVATVQAPKGATEDEEAAEGESDGEEKDEGADS